MASCSYLGVDVLENVLQRLPVKSLLRFRCVCKPWDCLIHRPDFVAKHHHFRRSRSRDGDADADSTFLLKDPRGFLMLSNIDSKPHRLIDFPASSNSSPNCVYIQGQCDGVVLLNGYGVHIDILWNPATKEYKVLPPSCLSLDQDGHFRRLLRIGVDRSSSNPKPCLLQPTVISIALLHPAVISSPQDRYMGGEIYTSTSDSWREIELPQADFVDAMPKDQTNQCINGVAFWTGRDSRLYTEEEFADLCQVNVLILFHLATEKFDVVNLPLKIFGDFLATVLKDCIAICAGDDEGRIASDWRVWVMTELGVEDSWVMLYTLKIESGVPPYFFTPIEFSRRDGDHGEQMILLQLFKDLDNYPLTFELA